MKSMMLFKKMILAALAFALALAAFPLTGVSAVGQADPLPPAQEKAPHNGRLERIWARMNRRYERLGKFFDKSDKLADRANKMIARLKEAGESTTELEAALAAYEAAVTQAQPIYASGKDIVTSHRGFGANGKVTDANQAKETLKQLGTKLGDTHDAMDGTARELIRLMKSIRKEHKPVPTPSADGA
jgi:hypothetical protein